MGVDLSRLDVGMTKHLTYGVDVGAVCKLQSGECVTGLVENN